ncbi:7678_t:CDS:2 [Acaulospora colombiana]|uniref:7678_t:CDS:1 n=1 Tax=Acaulospora colombiana TaxID=27376 RepID=A0ACA9K5K5_9GLOM|nr:7678_t:CDS:2 [Acaulospora colombiana]
MSANEHIRNTLTNIMPSQSNEMLSYEVFSDKSHIPNCLEGDNIFQEEPGKYDLDTVSVFVAKLYQLLDGDEYKEYLTWNETGDVFVICNMDEFAQNNQGETSPSSVYVNSKNGNITKDSPPHNLLTSFPESKDFVTHADKSDGDNAMRKRIAELTVTTENLRKDLKSISDIVNERLLPEVRSLTDDLQKHYTHLMELTQLVAYHSSPEDIQLLQEVSRGHSRHFPSHDFPSAKRARLDDKQTDSVKTERPNLSSPPVANVPTVPSSSVANVPTVPSSSVSTPYCDVFAPHSGNNLVNRPSPSAADPSTQGAPSASQPLTIPTDPHPAFNMSASSIIGEFQHPSHNAHSTNITSFNESWGTCPLIQDAVNTISGSFLFPTATSEHSPLLYSPSSNQQNSPVRSSQQHSPTSPAAPHPLSPAEYGDNTATASSSNDDHPNNGSNSPHNGDVIVAVSPTSTTSSPMSQ